MENIFISIVEDEALVRESLQELVVQHSVFELTNIASRVEDFLEMHHQNEPNILLLDINLKGGMTGLEGIRLLKQRFPKMEIIILTTFEDADHIFKALCAGASAYLTKRTPFSKIIEAIVTVQRGGSYMSPVIARKVVEYFAPNTVKTQLTARQHQIVDGVVEGLSYKLIADKLLISTETVRDHIKKIYKKLEINSKTELIMKKINGELS
ncbi:MAG: response regulator transcription factor [Bacteroidota bacterium]